MVAPCLWALAALAEDTCRFPAPPGYSTICSLKAPTPTNGLHRLHMSVVHLQKSKQNGYTHKAFFKSPLNLQWWSLKISSFSKLPIWYISFYLTRSPSSLLTGAVVWECGDVCQISTEQLQQTNKASVNSGNKTADYSVTRGTFSKDKKK